jgi:hypothetical protein
VILSAIGDCGKKLNRNLHIEKNEYAQMETNVEISKQAKQTNMQVQESVYPLKRIMQPSSLWKFNS